MGTMLRIVCPVCQHSNDDFAIKCVSCRSYIQERVPNLDFFATAWQIIESPKLAFKKIILAEHKNYVLSLALFFGIGTVFTLMWAKESGNNFDNLLPLLVLGIVSGVVVAIPLFLGMTFSLHGIAKLFNGKATFKETYGIAGWSLVPVMLSVVFVLPLELATLGLYFFSTNPSGYEVKPVVFSVLMGLDGISAGWSILLAAIGISMAHRFHFIIALLSVLMTVTVFSFLSFIVYSSFNI